MRKRVIDFVCNSNSNYPCSFLHLVRGDFAKCSRRRTMTTTTTASDRLRGMRLATEWIAPPNTASNNTSTSSSEESRIVVFLHGLLGNKRNVKSIAKNVCRSLGAHGLLVDIRGHGESQILQQQPDTTITTTMEDCVWDIHETIQDEIGKDREWILMGHSLGGRLGMLYCHMASSSGYNSKEISMPTNLWLLDTVPGGADASVTRTLDIAHTILETLPLELLSDRKQLTLILTKDFGIDPGTAAWLASSMNTQTGRFSFDLNVARDLLLDFSQIDFLGQIENAVVKNKGTDLRIDVVRGGANKAWESPTSGWHSLSSWEGEKLGLHVLPDAGHWVHIDDPKGLLNAVETVHNKSTTS